MRAWSDDIPSEVGGAPTRLLCSIPKFRENHIDVWSDPRAHVAEFDHMQEWRAYPGEHER